MNRPVAAMAAFAFVMAQAWAQEATKAAGHGAAPVVDEGIDNAGRKRWPITEATSWAVYESQLAPLLSDLQLDRASGRQYARAPERGTEEVIQDVTLAIRSELTAKECWSEQDLVVAGRRETIAIAVRFGVDGRFVEEPRLVSPAEMPEGDPALRSFIRRTFSALRACNVNGLALPPKYYEDPIWVYFIVQSRPE